jgi:hypothetical protein
VRIATTATDKVSGIGTMQVTTSKKRPGKAIPYAKRVVVRAATTDLWVRVRDRAGNWSGWKRAA